MDYSIHDAIEAGFNKIVFIIRKDIKDAFKEAIGDWCYHLFKPPYQYVMHIDAGDYRRTDRTLSTSFFGFFKFIVVHNPCLQHPSDKTDNIGVFDP